MTAEMAAALNLNGYTDLPAGKIATVVTYLEMKAPPPLPPFPLPEGWTLQRIDSDRPRYRALFRRVGEPWLWFSRAVMPDSRLASILDDPAVEAYALHDGQADIGLMELDLRSGGEAELAFLGLAPGFTGRSGASSCIPARSIPPPPCPSTSAPASRPTSGRSRWWTILASSAFCRGTLLPTSPSSTPAHEEKARRCRRAPFGEYLDRGFRRSRVRHVPARPG